MEVEGKCALVVEGTSGVGYAFADELLKMNAAVSVFICFENPKDYIIIVELLLKVLHREKKIRLSSTVFY